MIKFKKDKTYYLPDDDWKLKYKGIDQDQYHIFKVMDDPEWDEYLTKKGSEIYESKREYVSASSNDSKRRHGHSKL